MQTFGSMGEERKDAINLALARGRFAQAGAITCLTSMRKGEISTRKVGRKVDEDTYQEGRNLTM